MGIVFAFLALAFLASPVILVIWQLVARERMRKLERALAGLRDGLEARIEVLEARLRGHEDDFDEGVGVPDPGGHAPESTIAAVESEPGAPPSAPATSQDFMKLHRFFAQEQFGGVGHDTVADPPPAAGTASTRPAPP